jgi:hypothetical protein
VTTRMPKRFVLPTEPALIANISDQPAKTPKTTKLKLTTRTPGTAEKKEKKPAKKSEKRKSKAAVDDDEEMADAPEEETPKQLDPAAQKKAREREGQYLCYVTVQAFADIQQFYSSDTSCRRASCLATRVPWMRTCLRCLSTSRS